VSKYRTRVPVLADVAARILRAARRDENGCLISLLAPSQIRPNVTTPGGSQVRVMRVVIAVHLGRPVEAWEDVRHAGCRNVRCTEPSHLEVIAAAEHVVHDGAERRLERCPRHDIPYSRRDRAGRPHCSRCEAEASAAWRRRNPDYRRPLTEEQRLRRNERALRRYHEKRRAAA
jgi:hypothetical protein